MAQLSEQLATHYKEIYQIALKITKGNDIDAQDLTQEVYIIMLEYNQEKLKTIYDNGHLKFWVARVMLNQYLRSSSPFKKKHHTYLKDENALICDLRQDNSESDISYKIETEKRLELVNGIMNDLHFYDKTLFKVYYETNHSIRSLAEATGISTTSIFHTIKNVRNYIKDEIKDKQ
jgi:RNA polymerase sigma factor (sigma-70 family)